MLKKSASGVLASPRGSTYRRVRLASSLAAALLDGHFEHPARLGHGRLKKGNVREELLREGAFSVLWLRARG